MTLAAADNATTTTVAVTHVFLLGTTVLACAGIGLFFVRFWRRTRDRLFLTFGFAFWMLGVNWLLLAFAGRDEAATGLYVIRLAAFVLIIVGIWDKNRIGKAG